jgi:L-asparaginase
VILTGIQLPIGTIRTDGKENLITAIEIAAAKQDGHPWCPKWRCTSSTACTVATAR